jgi:hypothetical protein
MIKFLFGMLLIRIGYFLSLVSVEFVELGAKLEGQDEPKRAQ